VQAQTTIVISPHFQAYINKTKSIRRIEDIFSRAEQREMLKKQEPLRPVHAPWFELVEGDDFNHTVGHFDRYTGPSGGGDGGPSSSVMQVARRGDLASMFMQVLSTDTIQYIAKRTDVYAKREWVVPVSRRDRDGNITARPFYSAVYPNNNLNLPSNARHRWIPPKGNRDFDITDNFVLAWLGIVIYSGALFSGDNNRGINAIYSDAAYGISVPFIQNTMTRNAFKFMLRYIHYFCLQGLTTGIAHKHDLKRPVAVYYGRDSKRTRKVTGCVDKRVNLQRGIQHCRQCYRERTGTHLEKMDGIPKTYLGCPGCEEQVCGNCWKKGYDMHMKPSSK
jgi:hypothetical protein